MTEPVAERPYMPDYGVDTAEWSPLPWSWAAAKLAAGRNYWVVTASADARPHALPVWGVWDDDEHRFAWSCAPRSRKAANVAANPQATVAVDDTVECLSIEGRAALVEDGAPGPLDRALPGQVHADLARSQRRLPAPEPDRRVRAGAGVRGHRAGGRVLHPRHPLALRRRFSGDFVPLSGSEERQKRDRGASDDDGLGHVRRRRRRRAGRSAARRRRCSTRRIRRCAPQAARHGSPGRGPRRSRAGRTTDPSSAATV